MHVASVGHFGLSPMQSGMLFQWMLGSTGTANAGYDIEQIHITLRESIDSIDLGRAFTWVTQWHDSLRTCFVWDGTTNPFQQVHPVVSVPVSTHNWHALDKNQRDRAREKFLKQDRLEGFELGVAPLMRVSLFQCPTEHTEIIWTVHHIVIDGRSFPFLLQQVFSAYDQLRRGQEIAPPTQPRPYRDFIAWLEQQNKSAGLVFFQQHLRNRLSTTALPCAESLANPLPYSGCGQKSIKLASPVVNQLGQLASETGTPASVAVQAALALLLSRYTGEQDVMFGSVRSLRQRFIPGDSSDSCGLFINTLPVRVQLDDDALVADLLHQLTEQNLAMRAHSHLPLIDIQGVSEIPRGTPLFETVLMFDSQEINDAMQASGDSRWRGGQIIIHEQPPLPLTFTVFGGERLEINVLFDRRRFTDSTAERLALALATILENLSQGAKRRLGMIDILSADERQKIVHTWNATGRAFPDTLKIHELFEQQVSRQPDAPAVEMDGVRLSFLELDHKANQLAHVLQSRGAGVGRYIGLCLDRSPNMVIAMLATAKSGSPYVPLDPQYPPERIAFMVEDTAALLVITQQRFSGFFPQCGIVIDGDDWDEIAASPTTPVPRMGSSMDVCYAIFTSGSTGQPKGVVLCHRAVVNTFDWVSRSHRIGPGDRLLFVTSPCFDLSVYDVFGVLGAGGTVVVASTHLLSDPQALAQAITRQNITVWDSAPAALQRLTPYFPPPAKYPLRLVMLSGDWIPLPLPGALRAAFEGVEVTSLGGATEAAIWSNYFHIGDVDPRWSSIPYGKPIQNANYHVLDAALRPVPVGVAGDLYIGGACLAQGYLNRPELTHDRFIPNHLFNSAQARLYKTGDLARYWEDGTLEFLGRADFQVKIRGFRVETGEIEATLLVHPGVNAAVCTTWVDGSNQKSLVAYVVPVCGSGLSASAIKSDLARKLPDYMVPTIVMLLDALPLSSNGKLDRKALPSPLQSARETVFADPESPFEKDVSTIWQDLLQCGPIGLNDNFFDLGGHSLLAVMLMARLRQDLGLTPPLSSIIEYPTLRQFTCALQATANPAWIRPYRTLIPLRMGGPAHLFLVHEGYAGEALMYRDLALSLDRRYSVHGVVPRSLPGIPLIDTCIESMAQAYLCDMRAVQPHGPYHLGGLCSGGVIAYEMAIQLQAMGETVGTVLILDAIEPRAPLTTAQSRVVQTRDPEDRPAWWKQVFFRHLNRLSVWAKLQLLRLVLRFGVHWPTGLTPLTVEDIYLAAKAKYFPGELRAGRVVVFTASEGIDSDEPEMANINDPFLGWVRVVRCELEAVAVGGGHFSMLKPPHVATLGRQVSARLG